MSIIALMTDYGTRDHYVAAMKGTILQVNPKATIVDVCHDIGSQDLLHGAFVLRQSVPYFPVGTVFVAVVDPGVGSDRAILAAQYSGRVVLAPDNGLLTLLHRDGELQEMRVVENRRFFAGKPSNTFHGRDIFAPVAGHLSRGLSLTELGRSPLRIEALDLPVPKLAAGGSIEGEVLIADHFGNLITNIPEGDLARLCGPGVCPEVWVGPRSVGPVRTAYADVAEGEAVALIGGTGMLEIAVNRGSAAHILGAKRGDPVLVR